MNLKPKPFEEYLQHASVRNLLARREAIRKEMNALAKIDFRIRNELVRRTDSKEVAHADAKCEKIALDKVPPHIV